MLATKQEFMLLIERVKAGDDVAMAQLMLQYRGAMCRAARQLIGKSLQSQFDSVDLVQSVQLVLWMGLRTGKFEVETPQAFLGLARTLLRRKVARFCRAQKLAMAKTVELKAGTTFADVTFYAPAPDADPSELSQFDDIVEHFLDRLSEVDRRLIRMRFQGFSTADAARELGIDSGVLRVRLGRLRKRFADFRHSLSDAAAPEPAVDADLALAGIA